MPSNFVASWPIYKSMQILRLVGKIIGDWMANPFEEMFKV